MVVIPGIHNGKFVAVGMGVCAHSDNGTTFNKGTIADNNIWLSICYGNGKFVVVGDNGALAHSDNGTDFDTGNITGGNTWMSICYGNGKFVAVGKGGALSYSDNGTSFTPDSIHGNYNWNSVCYGNGKFIAVGNNGALAHSDNGTSFDSRIIAGNNSLNSVCYGNGKFVAVGNNGTFAYSENGIDFETGNIDGSNHLNSVCYSNGKFVAVGIGGTFAYSENGTTFDKGNIDDVSNFFSICYAESVTPSTSGLTLYTDTSNYAHIFANGKDILPNIPSNPVQTSQTITHEAPFTSSIENYSLRKPIYATGKVKSFNKESSTWTNAITNIDCICELKPSGTPDEFVGILVAYVNQNGIYTQSSTNARALLFATHGDFLFDVPSTENINVGNTVLIDGTVVNNDTPLTVKILKRIVGRVTKVIDHHTLAVFKD